MESPCIPNEWIGVFFRKHQDSHVVIIVLGARIESQVDAVLVSRHDEEEKLEREGGVLYSVSSKV